MQPRIEMFPRAPRVCVCLCLLVAGLGALCLPLGAQDQDTQRRTINILVRVTDANLETHITQAKVELLKFPDGIVMLGFTDSLGQVEFQRVPTQQSYIIRASKMGYADTEVQFDTQRGEYAKRVDVPLRPLAKPASTAPGDPVSAQELAVPPAAVKEFREGLKLLNEMKDPRGSIPRFRSAIGLWPNYPQAYYMLGLAYVQMSSPGEALTALRKAIELDPKATGPYHPLGVLLFSLQRYEEAEQVLLKAMESDPQGWQWPFELARCYAKQGKWDKALEYGLMAHDRPNAPTKVHLLMADLYSNTHQPGKAIEELEKFQKLDPDSPFMPRVQQALAELRRPQ